MAPNKRQSLWRMRRVFFLTPQVLQNDLIRGSCKAEEVILLVADEAHKALGNHAYCQVKERKNMIVLFSSHGQAHDRFFLPTLVLPFSLFFVFL